MEGSYGKYFQDVFTEAAIIFHQYYILFLFKYKPRAKYLEFFKLYNISSVYLASAVYAIMYMFCWGAGSLKPLWKCHIPLIVLSFATQQWQMMRFLSLCQSHYACLPFYLLFLMVLLADACLPKINMSNHHLCEIHLSKSESRPLISFCHLHKLFAQKYILPTIFYIRIFEKIKFNLCFSVFRFEL